MSVLNGLSVALAAKATIPIVVRAKTNTNTQLANAVVASVSATGNLAWKGVKDDASYEKDKAIKKSNSAKYALSSLQQASAKAGKMVIGARPAYVSAIYRVFQSIKKLLLAAKNPLKKPTKKEIFAKFKKNNWKKLTNSRKEKAVKLLSKIVAKALGIENPRVKFYNQKVENNMISRGYQQNGCININMNKNKYITSATIAATVAHECRHIFQRKRAANPKTKLDKKFKKNFENYIQPEHDFNAYKNQPVEKDARAYGKAFVKGMEL
ncbi:MAG: hypothetical protein FWH57_04225 [Oscillospiraceae bacterium]|nr:hypothetical protein [Oscillospiraceae bacterium]